MVLATAYRASMFAECFGDGAAFGLEISYVHEAEPLGTGGAIRNAASGLRSGPDSPVVVLNGDILSGHDISAQIDLHRKSDAAVTLHLVEVPDPARFGCVPTDPEGRVTAFLEKTPNPVTNRINAGCYVFRRSVIDEIPPGQVISVERVTFPDLIGAGALVMGYPDSSYWLDVGTPEAFVQGSCDLVRGRLASAAVPGEPGELLALEGAAVNPAAQVGGGHRGGRGRAGRRGRLRDRQRAVRCGERRRRGPGQRQRNRPRDGGRRGRGPGRRGARGRGPHRPRERAAGRDAGLAGPDAGPDLRPLLHRRLSARPARGGVLGGRRAGGRGCWGKPAAGRERLAREGPAARPRPAIRTAGWSGAPRSCWTCRGPGRARPGPRGSGLPGHPGRLHLAHLADPGGPRHAAGGPGAARASRGCHGDRGPSSWGRPRVRASRGHLRGWRRPGPVTVVRAAAWGPGAAWLLRELPGMLGADDDRAGFHPAHPVLAELAARHPGVRVGRSGRVLEALVPAVLEQKVVGVEARRAWRYLLLKFGDPAPGPAPAGMRVCPPPRIWRRIPSWEWHRAGVEGVRARTIIGAAEVAARLEEIVAMPADAADRRLRSLPGIGVWTSAEVRQRACGDADAVSVGDYHLPSAVGWALAGRVVDDAGMLELLAPYAGHRHRAARLVELGGIRPPRRGPRMSVRDYRAF